MSRLVPVMFALVALLSGCATSKGVRLPPLPAWKAPAGATAIPAVVVANETRARVPGVPVHYSDATYTLVNREWLDAFIAWTWHAAKAAGVGYTAESFDCENFTGLSIELIGLAASKAGVKASPLAAHLVVEWEDGKRHELMGIVTDRGAMIIEPQPDAGPFRLWTLEAYPHRILAITYGSFNPP